MSTEAEQKREYEAMLTLDDAVETLLDSGWTPSDLIERVQTIIEDAETP